MEWFDRLDYTIRQSRFGVWHVLRPGYNWTDGDWIALCGPIDGWADEMMVKGRWCGSCERSEAFAVAMSRLGDVTLTEDMF